MPNPENQPNIAGRELAPDMDEERQIAALYSIPHGQISPKAIVKYFAQKVIPNLGAGTENDYSRKSGGSQIAYCASFLNELDGTVTGADATYEGIVETLGLDADTTEELVRSAIEHEYNASEAMKDVQKTSPELKQQALENAAEEMVKHDLAALLVGVLATERLYEELSAEGESCYLSKHEESERFRMFEDAHKDISGRVVNGEEVSFIESELVKVVAEELNILGSSVVENTILRQRRISEIRRECHIPFADIRGALDTLTESANLIPDGGYREEALELINAVQESYGRFTQADIKANTPLASVEDFKEAGEALKQVKAGLGEVAGYLGIKRQSTDEMAWPVSRETVRRIEDEAREGIVAEALEERQDKVSVKTKGANAKATDKTPPTKKELEILEDKLVLEVEERTEDLIEHDLALHLQPLLNKQKPKPYEILALSAQNSSLWFEEPPEEVDPFKDSYVADWFLDILNLEIVPDEIRQRISEADDPEMRSDEDKRMLSALEIHDEVKRKLKSNLERIRDGGRSNWYVCSDTAELFEELQKTSLQIGGIMEGREITIEELTLRSASMEPSHAEKHDLEILNPVMDKVNTEKGLAGERVIRLAGDVERILKPVLKNSKLGNIPDRLGKLMSLQIAEVIVATKRAESDVDEPFSAQRRDAAREEFKIIFEEAKSFVYGDTTDEHVLRKTPLKKQIAILGALALTAAGGGFGFSALDNYLDDLDDDDGDHDPSANLSNHSNDIAAIAYEAVTDILTGLTPAAYAQENPTTVLQGPSNEDYLKNGSLSIDKFPYLGPKIGTGTTRTSIEITGNGGKWEMVYPEHYPGVTTKGMAEYSMSKHNSVFKSGWYTVTDQKEREYEVYIPEGSYDPNQQIEFNRHQPRPPQLPEVHVRPERPYIPEAEEPSADMQPIYSQDANQEGSGNSGGSPRSSGGQGSSESVVRRTQVVYVPPPPPPPPKPLDMDSAGARAVAQSIGGSVETQLRGTNRSALNAQTNDLLESGAYCDNPEDCAVLAKRITTQARVGYIEKTIQPGESLSSIARWYAARKDAVTHDPYQALQMLKGMGASSASDERSFDLILAGDKIILPVITAKKPAGVSEEELDDRSDTLEKERDLETSEAIRSQIESDPEALKLWQVWQKTTTSALKELQNNPDGNIYLIPDVNSPDGTVKVKIFTNYQQQAKTSDPNDPRTDNTNTVIEALINKNTGEVDNVVIYGVDDEEINAMRAEAQEKYEDPGEHVNRFLARVKWNEEADLAGIIEQVRENSVAAENAHKIRFDAVVGYSLLGGGTSFVVPEGAEVPDPTGFKGLQIRMFVKTPAGEEVVQISGYKIIDFYPTDGLNAVVIHEVSEELYDELQKEAQFYKEATIGLDPETFRPAVITEEDLVYLEEAARRHFTDPDDATHKFWDDLEELVKISGEDGANKHVDPGEVIAQAARIIRGSDEKDVKKTNDNWKMMLEADEELGTDITKNLPDKMAGLDLIFSRGYHELKAIFDGITDFDWAGMDDEELENLKNALITFGNISLLAGSDDAPEEFRQALDKDPVLKEMIEKHSDDAARILNTVRSEEKIREFADDAVEGQIQRLPSVRARKGEDGKIIPVVNIKDNRIISGVEEMMRVAERLKREQSAIEPEKQDFLEFMFTPQVGDEELELIRLDEVHVGPVLATEDDVPTYPEVYENKNGREMIQIFVPGIGPEEKGITVAVDRQVFDKVFSDPDLRKDFLDLYPNWSALVNAPIQQAHRLERVNTESASPAQQAVEFVMALTAMGQGITAIPPLTREPVSTTMAEATANAREQLARQTGGQRGVTEVTRPLTKQQRMESRLDFRQAELLQRQMREEEASANVLYGLKLKTLFEVDTQIRQINPTDSAQRETLKVLLDHRTAIAVQARNLGIAAGLQPQQVLVEISNAPFSTTPSLARGESITSLAEELTFDVVVRDLILLRVPNAESQLSRYLRGKMTDRERANFEAEITRRAREVFPEAREEIEVQPDQTKAQEEAIQRDAEVVESEKSSDTGGAERAGETVELRHGFSVRETITKLLAREAVGKRGPEVAGRYIPEELTLNELDSYIRQILEKDNVDLMHPVGAGHEGRGIIALDPKSSKWKLIFLSQGHEFELSAKTPGYPPENSEAMRELESAIFPIFVHTHSWADTSSEHDLRVIENFVRDGTPYVAFITANKNHEITVVIPNLGIWKGRTDTKNPLNLVTYYKQRGVLPGTDWQDAYDRATNKVDYARMVYGLIIQLENPDVSHEQKAVLRTEALRASDVMLRGDSHKGAFTYSVLMDEVLGREKANLLRTGDISEVGRKINRSEYSLQDLGRIISGRAEALAGQGRNAKQIIHHVREEMKPLLESLKMELPESKLLTEKDYGAVGESPIQKGEETESVTSKTPEIIDNNAQVISREDWTKHFVRGGPFELTEAYNRLQGQLRSGNLTAEEESTARQTMRNISSSLIETGQNQAWLDVVAYPEVFGLETWKSIDALINSRKPEKERVTQLQNSAFVLISEKFGSHLRNWENEYDRAEGVIQSVREEMKPLIEEAGYKQGPSRLIDFEQGPSLPLEEGGRGNAESQLRVVMLDYGNRDAFNRFVIGADDYGGTWKLAAKELETNMNLRLYEDADGRILGAIKYKIDTDSGEIVVDTIESIARRSGVGTALMESVFKEAVEREMKVRIVTIREDAYDFYRTLADRFGGEVELSERIMKTTFEWEELKERFEYNKENDTQFKGGSGVEDASISRSDSKELPVQDPVVGKGGWEGMKPKEVLDSVSQKIGEATLTFRELKDRGEGNIRETPTIKSVSEVFAALRHLAAKGYQVEGLVESSGPHIIDNLLLQTDTSSGVMEMRLPANMKLVRAKKDAVLPEVNALEAQLIGGIMKQELNRRIGERKNELAVKSRLEPDADTTQIQQEIARLEREILRIDELTYRDLFASVEGENELNGIINQRVLGEKTDSMIEQKMKIDDADRIISLIKQTLSHSHRNGDDFETAIAKAQQAVAPELEKFGIEISAPRIGVDNSSEEHVLYQNPMNEAERADALNGAMDRYSTLYFRHLKAGQSVDDAHYHAQQEVKETLAHLPARERAMFNIQTKRIHDFLEGKGANGDIPTLGKMVTAMLTTGNIVQLPGGGWIRLGPDPSLNGEDRRRKLEEEWAKQVGVDIEYEETLPVALRKVLREHHNIPQPR